MPKFLRNKIKELKKYLYTRSRNRFDREHRNAHPREYAEIDQLINSYLSTLGFVQLEEKKKNQAYKLLNLKTVLETHKPKNIVEFGSGSSSIIFKNYAEKYKASFTSIEESEDWAEQTRRYICTNDNKDFVRVITKEKEYDLSDQPPTIRYKGKIEGDFDFVFIDGPSLQIDGKIVKNAANKDVIYLDTFPKMIVIDGRESTALYLKDFFDNKYSVQFSDLMMKSLRPNYNYFTVLTRN